MKHVKFVAVFQTHIFGFRLRLFLFVSIFHPFTDANSSDKEFHQD